MTFLPIVDRELRIRARWRSTYLVRALVAVIAIGVATVTMLFALAGSPGSVGHALLMILAWMAFTFCVFEGFRNTADCLSEEKREGTLGLLFLTDLKGYDVVLGKFAATSLSSFYGLLAIVPALAIPVLVGGVTGGEFWRVVLALINALFFSLCAGMLVSSVSRSERKAWTGAAALVAVVIVLFPIAYDVIPALGWLTPTSSLINAFDKNYTAQPDLYWQPLWITHLLGWCCLVLASCLLPRTWQESGAERVRRRPIVQDAQKEFRRRMALLAMNPIWWLTSRHDYQRRWLWWLVVLFVLGSIGIWLSNAGDTEVTWILFGCALLLHFLLCVWVASEACYSFAEARSSGAMELLLSTPLTVRQILRGQHLAIRQLFFGPVVFLLAAEFAVLAGQIYLLSQRPNGIGASIGLVIIVGFCLIWFALDLFAVSRVGMWFGLTSAKPTHALTRTVLLVLVLPTILFACPCFNIIGPGLMVAKSVILFTWAQSKLENEFRLAATQRFDVKRDWWRRREPPKLKMPGPYVTG